MRAMNCPRCGCAISVAGDAAQVRCPNCFAEYRVKQGSTMPGAVRRAKQASPEPSAPAPVFEPPPETYPAQQQEPPAAGAAFPQAGYVPPPPGTAYLPPHYAVRPVRVDANSRAIVFLIITLMALLLAGALVAGIIIAYKHGGFIRRPMSDIDRTTPRQQAPLWLAR